MKKIEFKSAYLISMSLAMVACSESEVDDTGNLTPEPISAHAAFVLNQGNAYSGIDGGLNVINLESGLVTHNVFKSANGITLGSTPQCGVVYGSKIYIGVSESKTIEVIDLNTYKSIRRISLEKSTSGNSPRSMVATGGKIYVSLYEGYVARMDTTSLEIESAVKVGANPDVMCLHKGKLYVPNSEGMNYLIGKPYGTTASVVSLNPFQEEKQFTVPLNPTKFMSTGNNLYLLSMGDYFMESSAVYKISEDLSAEKVADATIAATGDNLLVIGNNPYVEEGSLLSYTVVDAITGKVTKADFKEAPAPSNLAIDPLSGKIIITTYETSDGVFADYESDGWACEYDTNLHFVNKYRIGTGPTAIFFND